jgi:hypothetical protein
MRTAATSLVVSFWASLLLCGCGSSVQLGQIDGTLRLDGQPFNQVMVTFIPEDPQQPQSIGITDAEGRFRLRCGKAGVGAVVGPHRVTLVDAAVAPGGRSRDDDELPEGAAARVSRVPQIYARPDKTPLRQSVAPGSQNVTFDILSERKPS